MDRVQRKRRLRLLLLTDLALLVLCALCVLTARHLSGLLPSQQAAERWQGDNDLRFDQVSCFLPVDERIQLNQVFQFRYDMLAKFKEALPDEEEPMRLFRDAWSTSGKVVAATSLGKGDARVIAVGGSFFDFHPIRLINGSYLSEEDLMQDRVLLDEDLAWLLFGGTELQGMELRLNGVPYVVGGVIQREQDFASKKAYTAGMGLYMSYDGYKQLYPNAGIDCYELIMAQPVRNFTINFTREKFPIGQGSIVENTDRFSFARRMKVISQFGSRSMQSLGVVLPYWENAARCVEDWCALLTLLALVLALPPAVTALVGGVRLYKRGYRKLTEDWIPDGRDKIEEAIRVRQRRRWLKKHGQHE